MGCRKLREAVCFGSSLAPVAPEVAVLRVKKGPVIDASWVNKRSWPGVRAKRDESEVRSPAWDCFVSQGGGVADGTEVGENEEVPETTESEDWVFVLSECEAEM